MCIHYCHDFECECRPFACETELCESWKRGGGSCKYVERRNYYTNCPRCWAGKLTVGAEEARKAVSTFEDKQNALLAAVEGGSGGDMSSFQEALRAAKQQLRGGAQVRSEYLRNMSELTYDTDNLVKNMDNADGENVERSRCSRPSFWADDAEQSSTCESDDGDDDNVSQPASENTYGSVDIDSLDCPSAAFSPIFAFNNDAEGSKGSGSSSCPFSAFSGFSFSASDDYYSDGSDGSEGSSCRSDDYSEGSEGSEGSSCPSSAFSVFSASDDSEDAEDANGESGGGVPALYVDDEEYAASSEYSSGDSDDCDDSDSNGSAAVRRAVAAYIDEAY
ncbi:MAG: hypothetical protein M1815_005304 [Lichina confinis]|nr:MAG: hypothetical protein M1815_005304 [Lichina confinis]